jgi:hypothetical protein
MQRMTWFVLLGAAIVVAALYEAGKADATTPVTNVSARHGGCSVASLKGTYAFRRTGINTVLGGPVAQIGIDVFNGDGTRGLIRTTRSTNGAIEDWSNFPPSGSYTVRGDCTGSIFDANGIKTNNLVVLDGGKGFFLLSVAPDTITTEEGAKLDAGD